MLSSGEKLANYIVLIPAVYTNWYIPIKEPILDLFYILPFGNSKKYLIIVTRAYLTLVSI